MAKPFPCKFCADQIEWSRVDGKFVPVNPDGTAHECQRQGRTAQAVDKDVLARLVQIEVAKTLDTALGDVRMEYSVQLGQAMSQVQRQAKDALDATSNDAMDMLQGIKAMLPDMVEQAVRKLVPVEHHLVVSRPEGIERHVGRPHYKLPQLVDLASLRMHSFLVGPAGSGKTTAAEQCAEVLGLPYYAWSMGPATSEWDLVGYRSPDGKYVPGMLREPYEHGGMVCLDEMDNTNPNVLTALNSLLANSSATFPDRRVKRHEDFVCVAGGNTYGRGADRVYVGRMQLDAASLDRFAVVEWDYDEEAEIDWAGRDQVQWVQHVQGVRHRAMDLGMRYIFGPRASINGAKMLRNEHPWDMVEQVWLWKGIAEEDQRRLRP